MLLMLALTSYSFAGDDVAFTSKNSGVLIYGTGDLAAVEAHVKKNFGDYVPVEVAPGRALTGIFFAKLVDAKRADSSETTEGYWYTHTTLVRKEGLADPGVFYVFWNSKFDNPTLGKAYSEVRGETFKEAAQIGFELGTALEAKKFSVSEPDCRSACTEVTLTIGDSNGDASGQVQDANFRTDLVNEAGALQGLGYAGKQYVRLFDSSKDQLTAPKGTILGDYMEEVGFVPSQIGLLGIEPTEGLLDMVIYKSTRNVND